MRRSWKNPKACSEYPDPNQGLSCDLSPFLPPYWPTFLMASASNALGILSGSLTCVETLTSAVILIYAVILIFAVTVISAWIWILI